MHKRLEDLEARTQKQQGYEVPRSMERYFHALTNARRQEAGLEPLPDLPYIKEDYEDDLKVLGEHLPTMRTDLGWQTEEAKSLLDQWERTVKERIERF